MSENKSPVGSASDSSATTAIGGDPGHSHGGRRATISGQASEVESNSSVHQELTAGLGLPFLARVSRGRLNVSEASVPIPTSSDISAAGELFIPSHEHPGNRKDNPHTSSASGETPKTAVETVPESLSESTGQQEAETGTSSPKSEVDRPTESGVAPAGFLPEHRSSLKPSVAAHTTPNCFGEISESIPEIRIQRPSASTMASSLGTSAVNSANFPATPVQTAIPSALSSVVPTTPSGPPLDPTVLTSALPVDSITSAIPVSLPIPTLPVGSKGRKRKKLVKRLRTKLVRKQVLALLLGRELANTVSQLLKAANSAEGGIPPALDGTDEIVSAYAKRYERKYVVKTKALHKKLSAAKLHAHAEDLQRCSTCRGLTRAKHFRRYHRLQMKKDRPSMHRMDRYATASARVAASKCRCPKQILGDRSVARSRESEVIEDPIAG